MKSAAKKSPPPPPKTTHLPHLRYARIDALRGVAVILMIFYHFCFDLNYFHWISVDFYQQPFWLNLRTFIVSLFLTLVGISLVLAQPDGVNWRAALPRLARLLACASLVSVGSYAVFPESLIFFGVLHFILLASIVGLWLLPFRVLHLPLGGLLLMIGLTVQHSFFNQPAWQWFGLMTYKPITEDYVPLLPWLGVVLLGMFVARVGDAWIKTPWQARGAWRGLPLIGKHSLLIYMLHQPVLMGVLWML